MLSPDGSRIAFIAGPDMNCTLFVMPAGGAVDLKAISGFSDDQGVRLLDRPDQQ